MSRTPRAVIVVLILLLVGLAVFLNKTRAHSAHSNWNSLSKPGPWGQLKCVHIAVEMPEPFISLEDVKDRHAHWYFKDHSREQIVSFLKSTELSAAQLETLLNHAKWEANGTGFWVSPPDELILVMSAAAREKIYSVLARFPENEAQYSPLVFNPDRVPEILQRSELRDTTIAQFNQLLYSKGNKKLFSDTDVLVNHLPDEREKVRFLKTISRVSTLLVKLQIDENSAIDELVDYWSYGGRKKDVRALLQSMASVPGGCSIDIAHLLPVFLRQRIYTYPDPGTINVTNRHCHWTSMNFLNSVPDDRFSDENFVKQTLGSEFVPVKDAPRLGDVFFLITPDGSVLHSATFIADDIVFTKNGGAPNRPWIYMKMEDMLACYMKPEEQLQIVQVRHKQL